ncbi:ABC transporter substrate-binding protein [Bradyrhizobium sp. CCGE-LA001]|uniref:ABC transporter substrate-binding protein n=1 Tax=Bradyrhizobium sp. CCGE-LA001 TaxID=1223566 RepID=UPI00030742EB|nr:ABC transporter substrate-binding protein [Bradyrhizobium sp. CCGE-LA001]AMA61570.1 spermidine/putrescine ABC transporter substrate-binding protein [Bradyrhizobium sp. CCGE-LA001]
MIADVLAVTVLAAGALAPAKPAFAGDQLTITGYGGAGQTAQRKALFEPFAKAAGVKVIEEEYNGEASKIRAMVESNSVSWDVVSADAVAAAQMCAEGILETIDWKRLGFDRAKFLGADKLDCGVPDILYATVLAYDRDRLPNGPRTLTDLFDMQKFPGKRGLLKSPFGNLEWALIADGVAIKDVYNVLSTPEGVDRALKKLDTIKKDVVWWQSGAQAPQLLADGQVVMTSAWNGRIFDANKNSGKHFEIVWDSQELGMNVWVMPKGGSRLDTAYKFVAFAGSPSGQAGVTRYISYGPANKDAITYVDQAILPHLPTAPDHMANALLVDPNFWSEKGDELRQRFTAWLAK